MTLPAKGPGGHSKIGASSAKRWWTCPGSVRLAAAVPNTSSPAAREGTAAHQIGEECLLSGEAAETRIGEVVEVEGEGIVVTEEMAAAVQVYLDEVKKWTDRDPDAVVHVESRFHLHEFHPDLFGTNDVCIWLPKLKLFVVLDYKHGAGRYVEARGNLQTRYYGLGGLVKYGYAATSILVGIVQPRCESASEKVRYDDPINPVDLLDWAADLVDAATRTEAPDAPLVPGDHCRETFCPAYAICPAVQNLAREMATLEFGAVAEFYDPVKLSEALKFLPVLEGWCKAVAAFAFAEAEQGRCPPDWKLVEKRGVRRWTNPGAAEAFMLNHLDRSKVIEEKLVTPAAAEKLLKSMKVGIPDDLVSKESSGFTLAPADDKRPAIVKGAEFPNTQK